MKSEFYNKNSTHPKALRRAISNKKEKVGRKLQKTFREWITRSEIERKNFFKLKMVNR